jgi:hypothetical protein
MKTISIFLFLALFSNVFSQWTPRTYIPLSGRNHPVTFSINGTGYLLTGGSDAPPFYYSDMAKYNPASDSWTLLPDFPGGARSFSYGVAANGFGYVGFGATNNTFFADWYRFDPVSETWTTLASCPCTPRTHPAMVATTNKIYVGLGGSAGGDLKDWWEYDIQNDSWTQRTDFPASRRHHPYYFGIGDAVYVGLGHHQADIFDDLYRYDANTDTWTQMASLPAEGRVAGTQFSYNGKGYILSGEGEDHNNLDTGEFWQYDPEFDSWLELPPHPGIARWAPGSFVIGDSVFLIAGQTEDVQPDERDVWMLNFNAIASTNELSNVSSLRVYPNPTNDKLYIDSPVEAEQVQVTNLLGEVLLTVENSKQLSVAQLPAGVYMLNLIGDYGTLTKRFVKQ